MVKIFMCSKCKDEKCDINKGIEIYEEFNKYIDIFKDVVLVSEECTCTRRCKGPTVEISGRLYDDFSVHDIKWILYTYYNNEKIV